MYESFSLNLLLDCTMSIHTTMKESIHTKRFIVQSKNLILTKIFIHHSMNALFCFNNNVSYSL